MQKDIIYLFMSIFKLMIMQKTKVKAVRVFRRLRFHRMECANYRCQFSCKPSSCYLCFIFHVTSPNNPNGELAKYF